MSFSEQNVSPQSAPELLDTPTEMPKPADMSLEEFTALYKTVMTAVAQKEKNGRLDPLHESYQPLTPAEQELLANDWPALSRQRGFSEADIAEYEIWRKLSGQTDNLAGAINDPWRRDRPAWAKTLWLKHIERALESGQTVSNEIMAEFQSIKTFGEKKETKANILIPKITEKTDGYKIDDVW